MQPLTIMRPRSPSYVVPSSLERLGSSGATDKRHTHMAEHTVILRRGLGL